MVSLVYLQVEVGAAAMERGRLEIRKNTQTSKVMNFLMIDSTSAPFGGRYWDRTSDPFHVKEVRYRCANRPVSESLLATEIILNTFNVILTKVAASLYLNKNQLSTAGIANAMKHALWNLNN